MANYVIPPKRFTFMDVILLFTMGLLIVFPNSFREIKLPLFFVSFIYSLQYSAVMRKPVILFLLLGVAITTIYVLVGLQQAKYPDVSTPQVFFVYAVTPILWSFICNMFVVRFKIKFILNWLVIFSILGAISIFAGIWLFDIGRLDILEYIIENPNKNLTDNGIIEMRLFVYGSLIFLIPAFMQVSTLYRPVVFWILQIIFIIASAVSGRSALLLAVGLGYIFFLVFNSKWKIIFYIAGGILLLSISSFILGSFGINLENVFSAFSDKITSTGDDPRELQFKYLFEKLTFFGNGHGVGVEYLRSEEFPWRYEILPLAILFRVGVIGLLIYSLPFLYSLYIFLGLKVKNEMDKFMFVGLFSMIVASFSNPYLESFEFNFFYVLPFIYFTHRK